jgi:hypothetical protein
MAQIEKANLAELDWALANIESGKMRTTNKPTVEMIDADARASKEDVRDRPFQLLATTNPCGDV